MANIFDSVGTFTIERLRSRDITYAAGAVASPGYDSLPIAIARGPVVLGPSAIGLANNQTWAVGVSIPAAPEVAWVIVNTSYHFKLVPGITRPAASYLVAFTDLADPSNDKGPILSPLGGTTDTSNVGVQELATVIPGASGGTFNTIITSNIPFTSKWIPLDPEDTKDGWQLGITYLAGAAGTHPAVDEAELDMRGIELIGYPVNAWATGQLWGLTGMRGS